MVMEDDLLALAASLASPRPSSEEREVFLVTVAVDDMCVGRCDIVEGGSGVRWCKICGWDDW